MKRLLLATALVAVFMFAGAGMALADNTYPPTVPPCSQTHNCVTPPPSTPTAFTGSSNLEGFMGAAAVLLVVGLTVLFIARRRSAE